MELFSIFYQLITINVLTFSGFFALNINGQKKPIKTVNFLLVILADKNFDQIMHKISCSFNEIVTDYKRLNCWYLLPCKTFHPRKAKISLGDSKLKISPFFIYEKFNEIFNSGVFQSSGSILNIFFNHEILCFSVFQIS